MNTNDTRDWKVLTWNVRGINSEWKWNAVKNKLTESNCGIACLQETKKEVIDANFIKRICPPSLDCFDYLPSVGASGGILVIWKSAIFSATMMFTNSYAISMEFCSEHNRNRLILTSIYAPYTT
jgi:exonuclease III